MREIRADNLLLSELAKLLYSEERACLRRVVFYDAECLYTEDDLIRLVNKFVETTEGEWTPQNMRVEREGLEAQGPLIFMVSR